LASWGPIRTIHRRCTDAHDGFSCVDFLEPNVGRRAHGCRDRGTERRRVDSAVVVRVERAAPLVSPAYADGATEATIEQRSLDVYGLMRPP
jgi:hypothetical protein